MVGNHKRGESVKSEEGFDRKTVLSLLDCHETRRTKGLTDSPYFPSFKFVILSFSRLAIVDWSHGWYIIDFQSLFFCCRRSRRPSTSAPCLPQSWSHGCQCKMTCLSPDFLFFGLHHQAITRLPSPSSNRQTVLRCIPNSLRMTGRMPVRSWV